MTWPDLPLGEAGKWRSGGTPSTTNPHYWGGDIPWISSGSLISTRLSDSERRLTPEGAANGTSLVDEGAILFVVRGMSLKSEFRVGRSMRRLAFGQDCKAIVVDRAKFQPEFLTYALKALEPVILGMVDEAGHGTGRLDTGLMEGLEVPMPDLATQTAIAGVLGALDDKIAANQQANESARALSQALVVRESAAAPVVSLSEVAEVRKNTITPPPGEVWHFSLPAFDDGEVPRLEDGTEIKSAKQRLERSSVLLSKLNPRIPRVWDVASVPRDRPALASTEFIVLEPRSGASAELAAALQLPASLVGLQSLARGTSGSHQRVSPADAMALEVPDYTQFSGAIRRMLTDLAVATEVRLQESRRLAATRDALLPALMSGRLSVNRS